MIVQSSPVYPYQNWKIFLCCIVCIYVELPPCTSVLIASEHGNHLQRYSEGGIAVKQEEKHIKGKR